MKIIKLFMQMFCWFFLGHDYFNGGESCRDCDWPRPVDYCL